MLIERIRYLMQERGVSASAFLVLTFTRRASAEMLERLTVALNDESAVRGMLIGTFHSAALTILRNDGAALGYDTDTLTVIDAADADMLLVKCAVDLGYFNDDARSWKREMSLKKVQRYREHFYSTGGKSIDGPAHVREACNTIVREYHNRLFQMNVLDFGMILVECRRLLSDFPEVRHRWQERIRYVVVDEIQDADALQFNIHDLFAPPAEFFVVGDTRQSIYNFRGARPDLIRERRPGAEVIDLRECFRCGAKIIDLANALIAHNGDTSAKPMICATGREGHVQVVASDHGSLVDHVHYLIDANDYQFSDIAVIARKHSSLIELEVAFTEDTLPVHRVGSGFDICDADDFRSLHAALRLIVNPRDDLAFLRLVVDFELTAEEYAAVRKAAATDGRSHFEAYLDLHKDDPSIGKTLTAFSVNPKRIGDFLPALAFELLGRTGPQIASFWIHHCGQMTTENALRWFALRDQHDDHTEKNEITLCTVHAAKGLEWPVVVVADLNQGIFPSKRVKTVEDMEEERRVAYVAFTRAKERLILHHRPPGSVIQTRWGEAKAGGPSRFLSECEASEEFSPAM